MENFFKGRPVISRSGFGQVSENDTPQVHFFSGRVGSKKEKKDEPEEKVEEVAACDDGMHAEAVVVNGRVERIVIKCGCGKETILRCRYDDEG